MKRMPLILLSAFLLFSCGNTKPASPESKDEGKPTAEEAGKPREEANTVEMTSEAQRRAGVVVTAATMAPMTQRLQTAGTVQPIDRSIARVRSLARGRLQEVFVKVGDRVAADKVLADLDNIEAAEASAQYNSAQAELQRLKIQVAAEQRQVERNRRLAEIGAAPQKDYESSLAGQQALEQGVHAQESAVAGLAARLHRLGVSDLQGSGAFSTAILAPFAGVIIRMSAAVGDVIESGAELFELADLSSVYVQAQVYEKDLSQIRIGQPAFIKVDAWPRERITGRVDSISDLIDPQTRTAAIRCLVANPDARLKLDMLAAIEFPTNFKRTTLSVPADALQEIDGKSVVFVRSSPERFSVRRVETGLTSDGRTEIVRGLSDGDPVVSKGAFAVKSVLQSKELGEDKD